MSEPSLVIDDEASRKARGAFFTPPPIADFLTSWALQGNAKATALDPTCGEAVFLLSAARCLRSLGCSEVDLDHQVFGVDIHEPSLENAMQLLETEGLDAHLIASDLFALPTPDQIDCPIPAVDAVIGNPPFVRYQDHKGDARTQSVAAALRQGVRLSGLASSWAAALVHASGFLKPDGRLAMVLPAELLTVHYAEPVRRWLRSRFKEVTLVMFERLQFQDAIEKVVLVLAEGTGGCESFTLAYLEDADDLTTLPLVDSFSATPSTDGKWTELLLPKEQLRLFQQVADKSFTALSTYGTTELGIVTGGNNFFALTEETRREFGLTTDQVQPICPPGSRYLTGLRFGKADWKRLRDRGERVWLLRPDADDDSDTLREYVEHGIELGVDQAYKCQIRTPWWRAPMVTPPDLLFTYMSHRYPRLVTNSAGVSMLNSMHGVRLRVGVPKQLAKSALPLLAFNSVTMLGAEIHGRAYGGGILKMEPREAARLPVPDLDTMKTAWERLQPERDHLDRQIQDGCWTNVAKRVDQVLLRDTIGLSRNDVTELHEAAAGMRERRISQ